MRRDDRGGPARLVDEARRLLEGGDVAGAEARCRRALERNPDDPDALGTLATIAVACEQPEPAAAMLLRAIELAPRRVDLRLALGQALLLAARPAEAAEAFQQACERAPDEAAAHVGLARALLAIGAIARAADSYTRAAQLEPDRADIWNDLGTALGELGRQDQARAAFERALALDAALPEVHANLGSLSAKQGHNDEAIAALEKAVQLAPGFARAHMNLGTALKQAGRYDEALAAYRRAIRLGPDDQEAHTWLGRLLLQNGDIAAARALCDEFLARHPGHAGLLAFKSIVLGAAGDVAARRELVDLPRFVRSVQITPPPEYPSLQAFNAALARHVETHPSLAFAPASHATQAGYHSGSLLAPPKGPMAHLERIIEEEITRYEASLPPDPAHPFLAQRPDDLTLDVWGVVMQGQGHQLAHVHPAARVSGCYYVQIPPGVHASARHEGWLEFGRPDVDLPICEPETLLVQPQEGLMVLFPSYVYHRTIPLYETPERPRISIAFDAVPVR